MKDRFVKALYFKKYIHHHAYSRRWLYVSFYWIILETEILQYPSCCSILLNSGFWKLYFITHLSYNTSDIFIKCLLGYFYILILFSFSPDILMAYLVSLLSGTQVILQSETIQELTKTSQALASLQEEASELRKLADSRGTEIVTSTLLKL